MNKRQIFRGLAAMLLALCLTAQAAAYPAELVPVGAAVGIRMETDGVVVTGFDDGAPARAAGLKTGDVIRSVDGAAVTQAAELARAVQDSGGRTLTLTALRRGKSVELSVTPGCAGSGYRLGVYLRDGIAGIGTVTYYDPETGAYGALGHGISDRGSTQLLPIAGGTLLHADVVGVSRGARGSPGQLRGAFGADGGLGTVERNTDCGIFGRMDYDGALPAALPVASREEVTTGPATVRCTVEGCTVREFTVNIDRVSPDSTLGREIALTVTDPALIEQTGGIVQGLSGAPIVQGGKLVGAVTHVLVSEPRQGYGILIDTMLKEAYGE